VSRSGRCLTCACSGLVRRLRLLTRRWRAVR